MVMTKYSPLAEWLVKPKTIIDLRDNVKNDGSNFNLSDKRLFFTPNLGFKSVKTWRGRLAVATADFAKSASVTPLGFEPKFPE